MGTFLKKLAEKYKLLSKNRNKLNATLKTETEIGLDSSSVSILFFFIFGTVCIDVAYGLHIISLNEFVSDFILWFTAIVVLDYTKETHDLKVNSDKEIKEVRKHNITDIRPYLNLKKNNNKSDKLYLINVGRGIAVHLQIKYKRDGEEKVFGPKITALSPGFDGEISIERNGIGDRPDEDETVEIIYEDMDGRPYLAVFRPNSQFREGFSIVGQKETVKQKEKVKV